MALAEECCKESKPDRGLCRLLLFKSDGRPSGGVVLLSLSEAAPILHGEGLAVGGSIVSHAETFKQLGKMDGSDHSVTLDLGKH
eukprot:4245091-Heterocapsa_arctica.AAC.1